MKINSYLDKFLNSSLLSSSIFIASGIHKTYKDYKTAEPGYKDRFLVKDCVVLSGTALGMLAHQKINGKIVRKYGLDKKLPAYLNDFLKGFTLFASGILGALGMDFLLSKSGFEQPEGKVQSSKNKVEKYIDSNIMRIPDKDIKNAVYSRVTDMPQMSIFTSSLIGAYAIDLSKDREFNSRLKHTTICLINNSLIPLLLLTTSSTLTKSLKAIYRIPIVFSSLVGGTVMINKATEKYIKNLD